MHDMQPAYPTTSGYAQAKLTQSVFYFLAEKERLTYPDPEKIREAEATGAFVNRKPKTIFSVGERFALLSSFAQLGVRPPPETISRVMDNSLHFLKFCSPQDTTNLVQALHSWRRVIVVCSYASTAHMQYAKGGHHHKLTQYSYHFR